ncbi:hypothetical protein FRB93_012868 [Tulasnella sp. JGI-2019a]|nr:hypothetical protein FRB93_012868 [Tulasnella sp. JGI-2019a]
MQDIPVDVANIIGLPIAMALYGVFLTMFVNNIRPLWIHRHQVWVVLYFTIALLITSTINVALLIVYNYLGWVKYRDFPGVMVYFSTQSGGIMAIRNLFLVIAAEASDLSIIWRMYSIWGRNRMIAVPPLTLLTIELTVTGILCAMWFKQYCYEGPAETAFVAFAAIGCACSILVNVGCTTMIATRIWWVGRHAPGPHKRKYKNMTIVLVESGAMYTTCLIAWSVFAILPPYIGTYMFITYTFTMVISIAPMLIVSLLNQSHTKNSPSAAMGDGVETACSTGRRPHARHLNVRRTQHLISTDFQFVSSDRLTEPPNAYFLGASKLLRTDHMSLEEKGQMKRHSI